MRLLTSDLLQKLASINKSPCLSIYQSTHRIIPDNLQDPLRFKNLVKQLEESLVQKYSNVEVKSLIAPFEDLANDNHFWTDTLQGIAVFGAFDFFETITLPIPVPELAIVASSFHLKPLRQYLQTSDRFQILALSLTDVQFYTGNRYSLVQVILPQDFPKNINEALGEELTQRRATSLSLSGPPGKTNLQHGQGTRRDEVEKDTERFFRVIDKEVHERISKNTKLPLILAALPEHHHLFHKISRNPMLSDKGIMMNPKSLPTEKLRKMAWEILEPEYTSKMEWIIAKFEENSSHGLGSENLNKVAAAAEEGRVDTLLLEEGRMIPGRIIQGKVHPENLNHPEVDDALDDLGELVSQKGGTVMIIPAEMMPVHSGLAAIYRY